jgi:hypothetical protein
MIVAKGFSLRKRGILVGVGVEPPPHHLFRTEVQSLSEHVRKMIKDLSYGSRIRTP